MQSHLPSIWASARVVVRVTVLAVASMVLGNLAALAQTSVRRLLAYSAIAHAGYMLLALAYFSRTPVSAQAVMYYILTYGLTAVGAFGVVGAVERVNGSDQMDAFAGCIAAIRYWLPSCWCCSSRWPGFRHWWDSGPSSICLLRFSAYRRVSAVRACGAGDCDERGVALLLPPSVEAGLCDAGVDDCKIAVNPVTLSALLFVALWVVMMGVFPAILQTWMESFYAVM